MKNEHIYANLTKDEYEELFSNYLIDSWSFSKVSSFARNEKAFEMNYIYRMPYRKSASAVAGNAYHEALDAFFSARKEGDSKDIVDLQKIAFQYIEDQDSNTWKIQKTTPTIEACKKSAVQISTALLENFLFEIEVYDLKEILFVEVYCDTFLTINGVDIPLPCHAKIDLVGRTHDDKVVIIDHKSKNRFSDEKELAFSIGKQAVTYYHCIKDQYGLDVDEVWFIENKYSKNRDKSPQLNCFKIAMDKDTITLYDALLYEPLRRMLEAVSNPDYVYLINESDNFIDKAEIHQFWSKTLMAEVDDFNIPESKREPIERRLKKIRDVSISTIDPSVIKKFRKNASEFIQYNLSDKDMKRSEKIEHVLRTLGLIVKVEHTFEGYSNDTFLLQVSAGVNMAKVYRYKLDIANALDVPSIRIANQLFVHEGKSYLAIESSKKRNQDLLFDPKYRKGQKIPIGKDNFNKTVHWDLDNPSTPHMLICGATGSGKSVSIMSTIEYVLLTGVDEVVVFDPKYEFTSYKRVARVEVFNEIEEIESKMESLVEEMNRLVETGASKRTLVVFDEFADAVSASKKGRELDIKEMVQVGNYAPKKSPMGFMMAAEPKMKLQTVGRKKSLEENLKVLLQKGRSIGYRIMAATQRASVKVITGDAKVNFPVQVCFRVPKEIDSKVVLGESGAESLAGKGDGLMNSPEYFDLVRFQAFLKE
jgi:hypothetical protein